MSAALLELEKAPIKPKDVLEEIARRFNFISSEFEDIEHPYEKEKLETRTLFGLNFPDIEARCDLTIFLLYGITPRFSIIYDGPVIQRGKVVRAYLGAVINDNSLYDYPKTKGSLRLDVVRLIDTPNWFLSSLDKETIM